MVLPASRCVNVYNGVRLFSSETSVVLRNNIGFIAKSRISEKIKN